MGRPKQKGFRKTCKVCKETKHIAEFHKERGGALGVKALCKDCRNEYIKNRRAQLKKEKKNARNDNSKQKN